MRRPAEKGSLGPRAWVRVRGALARACVAVGAARAPQLTSAGASAPRRSGHRGPPRPQCPAVAGVGELQARVKTCVRGARGCERWHGSRPALVRGGSTANSGSSPAPPARSHATPPPPPPRRRARRPAAHLRAAQRLLDGQPGAADVGHDAAAEGGVGHERVGRVVDLEALGARGGDGVVQAWQGGAVGWGGRGEARVVGVGLQRLALERQGDGGCAETGSQPAT